MLWANDWVYGAAVILLCIILHTITLIYLARFIVQENLRRIRESSLLLSAMLFAMLALVSIILHAGEAAIWASLFIYLGAVTDFPSAYLHSLGAFTTLGDSTIIFDTKWRLLIQLESLNGAVALGLTTAMLYSSAGKIERIVSTSSGK